LKFEDLDRYVARVHMMSGKQEAGMRYSAELYYLDEGEQYFIDRELFNAENDKNATQAAVAWATTARGQMSDRVLHLQLVCEGRGVFCKQYEKL
jgi:hypothetical protein